MPGRDLEYEKEREIALKDFNVDMERLSESDFEDFKTGVIKQLRADHGAIYTIVESDAEQKLELIERIRILETFLFTLALVSLSHIKGQELSDGMKKTVLWKDLPRTPDEIIAIITSIIKNTRNKNK